MVRFFGRKNEDQPNGEIVANNEALYDQSTSSFEPYESGGGPSNEESSSSEEDRFGSNPDPFGDIRGVGRGSRRGGLDTPDLLLANSLDRILSAAPAEWLASYRDPTISLEPLFHQIDLSAPAGTIELDSLVQGRDISYGDADADLVFRQPQGLERDQPHEVFFSPRISQVQAKSGVDQVLGEKVQPRTPGFQSRNGNSRASRVDGKFTRISAKRGGTSEQGIRRVGESVPPRRLPLVIPSREDALSSALFDGQESAGDKLVGIGGGWIDGGSWVQSERGLSPSPVRLIKDLSSNSNPIAERNDTPKRRASLPSLANSAELNTETSGRMSDPRGQAQSITSVRSSMPVSNQIDDGGDAQDPFVQFGRVDGGASSRGDLSQDQAGSSRTGANGINIEDENNSSRTAALKPQSQPRLGLGRPLVGGNPLSRESHLPKVDADRVAETPEDVPANKSAYRIESDLDVATAATSDALAPSEYPLIRATTFFPEIGRLNDAREASNWVSEIVSRTRASSGSNPVRWRPGIRSERSFSSPLETNSSPVVGQMDSSERTRNGDPTLVATDGLNSLPDDSSVLEVPSAELATPLVRDPFKTAFEGNTTSPRRANEYQDDSLSVKLITSMQPPLLEGVASMRNSPSRRLPTRTMSAIAPGGLLFTLSSDLMARDRLDASRAVGLTENGRIDISPQSLERGDTRALGIFAHELTHLYQQRAFQSRGMSMPHPSSVEGKALESQAEVVRSRVEGDGATLTGQFSQALRSGSLTNLISPNQSLSSPSLVESVITGATGQSSGSREMPVVRQSSRNPGSNGGGAERSRGSQTSMRFVSPIARELGLASSSSQSNSTPSSSATAGAQPLSNDLVNAFSKPKEEQNKVKEVERDDAGDASINQIYREILFRLKSDLRWERDTNSSFGKFYRM